MKRTILLIVTLAAVVLLSPLTFSASGQQVVKEQKYVVYVVKWYDDLSSIAEKYGVSPEVIMKVNGLNSTKLDKKQKLKIPVYPELVVLDEDPGYEDGGALELQTPPILSEEELKLIEEGNAEGQSGNQELIQAVRHPSDTVSLALLLPLNGAKGIQSGNYDFYSGVLLAVKDCTEEGMCVNLKVFDFNSEKVDADDLKDCDAVIGPITPADIEKALEFCPAEQKIISPLDPKSAALTRESSLLIQAPGSVDCQYLDIAAWIKEDSHSEDKVILFTEKGVPPTPLAAALDSAGITYNTISYGILEGRRIDYTMEPLLTDSHVNRFVIASDSEAFVNDVVRNISLMAHREYQVVIYAPSKIRNFETIEVENFHKTSLHVSLTYFVDYDTPAVKNFLMTYRGLYGAEPSPFSYQGYDITRTVLKGIRTRGSLWIENLCNNRECGLQSDFLMTQTPTGCFTNTAVRRVVYGEDFSIRKVSPAGVSR